MLPVFINFGLMITIWLFFIRLLEGWLPDGALDSALHYLYK